MNRTALLPHIEAAFGQQTTGWWLDQLAAVGVPAGPINPIDKVFAEPQAVHRGLGMQIEDDQNGSIPGVASPLRLTATPPQAAAPPPRLGAHSRAVLRDLLVMDEARINGLIDSGVIGEPS